MRLRDHDSTLGYAIEIALQGAPHLFAAGEPVPVCTNDAHYFEALIDGNDVVLPRRSDAIDKKSFDIGIHRTQFRVFACDVLPGVQREQRLDRLDVYLKKLQAKGKKHGRSKQP